MRKSIRIGTRESELATWQASLVKDLLSENGYDAELVFIKSEGDIDLQTPLYDIGVQGIFTRSLDMALLNNRIDIAVHSMKDVPISLAKGIVQGAVLKRASFKDILVYKGDTSNLSGDIGFTDGVWSIVNGKPNEQSHLSFTIATSSIRRKAQWLNRFPGHHVENLRGNVNTRLRKLEESVWNGAIFAAAGLERIGLRPERSVNLDWMLPAPAQGAIMIVCREEDEHCRKASLHLNHEHTAQCTRIERDFLKQLLGGCSTPISALATIEDEMIHFKGNMVSPDGKDKVEIEKHILIKDAEGAGSIAAQELLNNGGQQVANKIRHGEN